MFLKHFTFGMLFYIIMTKPQQYVDAFCVFVRITQDEKLANFTLVIK